MAYSDKERNDIIDKACIRIMNGSSLKDALADNKIPYKTFYEWLEKDKEKSKLYARACEFRADAIFEEILEISNHTDEDHTPFTGSNVIQRDRLKIDARKWMLAKMQPKKYGDKLDLDHTTNGESINVVSLGNGVKPPENNETTS